jgi:hypothetical protein
MQDDNSSIWEGDVIRILFIAAILLCIILSTDTDAQSNYEFRLDGTTGAGLSNDYVGVDFFNDTTIILKCNVQRRGWGIGTDLVSDRKVDAYEYLKYNFDDRIKWFIKDYILSPWAGLPYTSSPDKKTLIYISKDKDINAVYQHDLVTRERFLLDYPENFWAFGHTWSPTDDIVWVEGGIINPDEWMGGEMPEEPTIWFKGPTYYLYYPSKKEFKHIHSAGRKYPDPYACMESVWRADGKAVFFKYMYGFGVYGMPDSAQAYDAEDLVDFLYKYELESDSLVLLYAGDDLGGQMLPDQIAYDTSIVFKDIIKYQDAQGLTRRKFKQFISYNPESGVSSKIWSFEDNNRPGEVKSAFLSPDRKFVAYYTKDEFAIEVIGDTADPVIYTHPVELKGISGSADFSDNSRKICFTFRYIDRSELADTRRDFGSWRFAWGEIAEK